MSMDSLLRQEGQRLRDDVLVSLDVERAWEDLTAARRRRRRVAGLVGVSAVAASFVLAVALTGSGPTAVDREAPPVDSPTHAPDGPDAPSDGCVDSEVVQCLGDGMVRVRGGVTYRLIVPPGFDPHLVVGVSSRITDVHQKTADAGVSVLSGVLPADPAVGDLDAEALAAWLAARPFLDDVDVRRERLNGLTAWSVRLPVGADPWAGRSPTLEASCNDQQPSCRPLLRSPDGHETGAWTGMTSRYWLMDVPREGVTAVWSWTFDDTSRSLRLNDQLVDSVAIELAEELIER